MGSLSTAEDVGNIQIWMALLGALCILLFLFAPMPGRTSEPGSMIYMVEGTGEQWPMLFFAFSCACLVYYRLFVWAFIAAIGVLLMTAPLLWRFLATGLFSPGNGLSHYNTDELSSLHIWVLVIGVLLLLAASGWEVWLAWEEKRHHTISTTTPAPRRFDPRTINPQATVGFCYFCGSKNPLSRNQCLQCSATLPWIGTAPQPIAPKPMSVAKPSRNFFEMPKMDWTVWGVGLISFLAWPLGLILFFSYSKNGDDKANAALIGASVALLIFVARLVYSMSTVGH